MSYQASSPDEIALVKWSEQVGLCLTKRTIDYMTLTNCFGDEFNYKILQVCLNFSYKLFLIKRFM